VRQAWVGGGSGRKGGGKGEEKEGQEADLRSIWFVTKKETAWGGGGGMVHTASGEGKEITAVLAGLRRCTRKGVGKRRAEKTSHSPLPLGSNGTEKIDQYRKGEGRQEEKYRVERRGVFKRGRVPHIRGCVPGGGVLPTEQAEAFLKGSDDSSIGFQEPAGGGDVMQEGG